MRPRPGDLFDQPQPSSTTEVHPFELSMASPSMQLSEIRARNTYARTDEHVEASNALVGEEISSIRIHSALLQAVQRLPTFRFGDSEAPRQVLPTQVHITGPLYYGPRRVSSGRYTSVASRFPSLISYQLQTQPSFQMPLEAQEHGTSDAHWRTRRRALRRHPYLIPGVNDHSCRSALRPFRRVDESQLPAPNIVVEDSERFRTLIKRHNRLTFLNNHMNNTQVLTNLEETQTPLPRLCRIQMHENQTIWQLEGPSILSTNFHDQTLVQPLNEIGHMTMGSYNNARTESLSSSTTEVLTNRNPTSAIIPDPTESYPLTPFVSSNPIPRNSISSNDSFTTDLDIVPSAFNLSSPICDLQDLRIPRNVETELSNHDRLCEEVYDAPFSLDIDSDSSAIISYRLCALSMPSMPPPSAHARQVANKVIRLARYNKTPNESSMWCPNCGLFPTLPVTGQCGHTRCTKCIQKHGSCPCGAQAPNDLHVNTVIQDLIRKLLPRESDVRLAKKILDSQGKPLNRSIYKSSPSLPVTSQHVAWSGGSGARARHAHTSRRSLTLPSTTLLLKTDVAPRIPMLPQSRLAYARELLVAGRYREAAPHFARVAASSAPLARFARSLLAQAINMLSQERDPRRLTRELYRSIRLQSAAAWLRPADLECVLCYHTYTEPVTTPCGHTYCRICIERSMDYRKSCALCLRPLDDFNLTATRETVFICAALDSIDALSSPLPPDPDVIPIFVCTVAYPTIPCPLFIFDPRYWMMIRRVLESGSRKFGMVAYERDRTYSDYGTVLEVCDCVHLEDGRSILSTVGVSRFKVIERDVRDGCDVARIQPLTDITPTEELIIWNLRIMATQISYKALLWLNGMNRALRSEIEAAFGRLPYFDRRVEAWWESPDGPAWLWWLIAILPLRSEIKVLILSTKDLLKRMMAVLRTLEAIDQVTLNSTVSSECELLTNAQEWLERSS